MKAKELQVNAKWRKSPLGQMDELVTKCQWAVESTDINRPKTIATAQATVLDQIILAARLTESKSKDLGKLSRDIAFLINQGKKFVLCDRQAPGRVRAAKGKMTQKIFRLIAASWHEQKCNGSGS